MDYGYQDVAPYGLCDRIRFKGFNGADRIVRISYASLASVLRSDYSPQTPEQLFPQLDGGATQDLPVVKAVWLPDGRSYQFQYNSFNELARVQLPTGGVIEYDYEGGELNGTANGVVGAYLTQRWLYGTDGTIYPRIEIYRRLVQRRIYPDGSTVPSNTTTYGKIAYGNNPSIWDTPAGLDASVTIKEFSGDATGPELSRTQHFFHGNPIGSMLNKYALIDPMWNEGKEYQTDAIDTATSETLRRVSQTWADAAMPGGPRVIDTTTSLLDVIPSLVAKQSFDYDQYNNLTDTHEYDFGNNQPGALVRHSETDYLTTNNGADYTSVDVHIRSLPIEQRVFDSGGILRSRSLFEYDNYNQITSDVFHSVLSPRSNIIGLDNSFTTAYFTRGNPTKTTRYLLDQTGDVTGSVSGYAQYDIAGNVIKVLDPRSTVSNIIATTFEFNDRFGSPDTEAQGNTAPGQLGTLMTYAFPTKVTNAQNHVAFTQYDYYLGAPVNTEDPNQVVSSLEYGNDGLDLLDRPSRSIQAINTGAKSQTKTLYNDVTRIVTTTSDLEIYDDNLLKSEMLYDGLGRTIEARQYETGTTYITTKQEYDALSRVKRSYNPHRTTSESTYGWTETTYDSLSRLKKVETFDLSGELTGEITTAFSGDMVLVTDQANKKRLSKTNALGQLTHIWEIKPADGSTVSVSFAGQNLTGYLTQYSYDVLSGLTNITQGSQTPRIFAYNSLRQLTDATNPEGGHVIYDYDEVGNLRHKTDARGVLTTYSYDSLSRLNSRTYSDGTPPVTYGYDAPNGPNTYTIGRLTSVSSSVSTYAYGAYDPLGRVKTGTQTTEAAPYSMSYEYNLAGGMISQTYPSGRIVKTGYDDAGRIAGVKNDATETYYAGAAASDTSNRIQYSSAGAAQAMKLGNGLWEHTNFNSRLQAIQIGLGTSSTDSSKLKLDYAYGVLVNGTLDPTKNNGNVQGQTITLPGLTLTQSYEYDELNRLKVAQEANGANQSWKQTFTYDRFGNRNFDAGNTTLPQITPQNEATTNPAINPTNNRISTAAYRYDAAGNLECDPDHPCGATSPFVAYYAYNGENLIKTAGGGAGSGGSDYSYDGNGKRVKKTVGGAITITTVFVYDITGQLVAEYSDGGSAGGGTSYLTSDSLGSPRVITGPSQEIKARHDYLPFGEEISSNHGGRLTDPGYVTDTVRQKFTLKERDIETGLDYFLARYYSSTQGRFTSPDEFTGGPDELYYFVDDAADNPTFYADLTNPQSINKYQYVLNNPLRYTDDDGHCGLPCVIARSAARTPVGRRLITKAGAAATTAIVAASGAAKQYWELLKKYPPNAGDMIGPPADSFQYFNRKKPDSSASQQGQGQQQGGNQSNAASPGNNDEKPPFGSRGTQTTSTTVYNGKGERIDVENPNPGQRAGQIHYQSGDTKLLYDPNSQSFIGASKTLNKRLMNDPQIQRAIKKGLKILGESE